jgi:hypothetical protein
MTADPHRLSVAVPWPLWLELHRFCRYYGYDEAAYVGWLVAQARARGRWGAFPVPPGPDDHLLQHCDEA